MLLEILNVIFNIYFILAAWFFYVVVSFIIMYHYYNRHINIIVYKRNKHINYYHVKYITNNLPKPLQQSITLRSIIVGFMFSLLVYIIFASIYTFYSNEKYGATETDFKFNIIEFFVSQLLAIVSVFVAEIGLITETWNYSYLVTYICFGFVPLIFITLFMALVAHIHSFFRIYN